MKQVEAILTSRNDSTVLVISLDIQSASFSKKFLALTFMTTIMTTLFNRFWRFLRISLRSEHPMHVSQNHQKTMIPIKNTIRMMIHKTLTKIMMLSWKLQCTTTRKMPWQGSVLILPRRLNSLSTGQVFCQTPPLIPIMNTSRKNCKPFMGDLSTSTTSNGFDNQRLQKNEGLIPSVSLQAVILHVQTL